MTTQGVAQQPRGWRVVDIVVGATVAAAFGVVFLVWNGVNAVATPLFVAFPPAQAVLYGVWLLPGLLVALIVQRPGAAVLGGVVSAAVSVLLGSIFGLPALVYGVVQGLGAELGFAASLYRRWGWPTAVGGGLLSGLGAAVLDVAWYFRLFDIGFQVAYVAFAMLSGALAGMIAVVLVRRLAASGVLAAFPSGRAQERV